MLLETLIFRFSITAVALLASEHMAQIQIHQRRIKQQTVEQVEYSADAGKRSARVLDAGLAFEKRLDQVADDRGGAQNESEQAGVFPVHTGEFSAGEMCERHTRESGHADRAGESLPGFAGADARYHLVSADQGAYGVCAGIAELGDQNKIEHVIGAVGLG